MKKKNYQKYMTGVVVSIFFFVQCSFKPSGWHIKCYIDLNRGVISLSDTLYSLREVKLFQETTNENSLTIIDIGSSYNNHIYKLSGIQKQIIDSTKIGTELVWRIKVLEKDKNVKIFNPLRYYHEMIYGENDSIIILNPFFI